MFVATDEGEPGVVLASSTGEGFRTFVLEILAHLF
jgi:hypothetical protein